MKKCSRCGDSKVLDDFHNNASKRDGKQSYCKDCSNAHNKVNYKNSPDRRAKLRKSNEETKARNRLIILKAKALGCSLCCESEPVVLDFHHRDPEHKDMSISNMLWCSEERLIEEIGKCVVLCSNCHRKVHAGILKI